MTDDAGGQPGESEKERIDRELIELLNELRVALPGVQVLFAFLLVVPFQQRFAGVSDFQKTVYFVSLLLAAGACALLVAPSAYHRILFRSHEKRNILEVANGMAIAGLALLGTAIVGVLVLIADYLYGGAAAFAVGIAAAAVFATLWYALPLRRR